MRIIDALRVLLGVSIAVPRAASPSNPEPAPTPVKIVETAPVEVVAVAPEVLGRASASAAVPPPPSSLAEKTVGEARQTREQLERTIGDDPLVGALEETIRGGPRRKGKKTKGAPHAAARRSHAG